MNILRIPAAASAVPSRQRLITDITMRQFSAATQRNYMPDVGRLPSFLRKPPNTASTKDVHRFQFAL